MSASSKTPAISIVVIAYKVAAYLERCLRSLERQSCDDFEVIVVNDGSPDESGAIAHGFEGRIGRLRVIDKLANEGAHLARKTGCMASAGRYVLFLDGDDELAPTAVDMLLHLAQGKRFDMLRFGRTVADDSGEAPAQAFNDEAHFNASPRFLEGSDIARDIYGDDSHSTWSIIDVLFDGDFARDGFAVMTDEQLGRMQDSYEMFVLSKRAHTYYSVQEYHALVYHLGSGVSGHGMRSISAFLAGQHGMQLSCSALLEHAQTLGGEALHLAQNYRARMVETVSVEWASRVKLDQQADCFPELVSIWGVDFALCVLLGPLNGRLAWLLNEDDKASYKMDIYMLAWEEALAKVDYERLDLSISGERLATYKELRAKMDDRIAVLYADEEPMTDEPEKAEPADRLEDELTENQLGQTVGGMARTVEGGRLARFARLIKHTDK